MVYVPNSRIRFCPSHTRRVETVLSLGQHPIFVKTVELRQVMPLLPASGQDWAVFTRKEWSQQMAQNRDGIRFKTVPYERVKRYTHRRQPQWKLEAKLFPNIQNGVFARVLLERGRMYLPEELQKLLKRMLKNDKEIARVQMILAQYARSEALSVEGVSHLVECRRKRAELEGTALTFMYKLPVMGEEVVRSVDRAEDLEYWRRWNNGGK